MKKLVAFTVLTIGIIGVCLVFFTANDSKSLKAMTRVPIKHRQQRINWDQKFKNWMQTQNFGQQNNQQRQPQQNQYQWQEQQEFEQAEAPEMQEQQEREFEFEPSFNQDNRRTRRAFQEPEERLQHPYWQRQDQQRNNDYSSYGRNQYNQYYTTEDSVVSDLNQETAPLNFLTTSQLTQLKQIQDSNQGIVNKMRHNQFNPESLAALMAMNNQNQQQQQQALQNRGELSQFLPDQLSQLTTQLENQFQQQGFGNQNNLGFGQVQGFPNVPGQSNPAMEMMANIARAKQNQQQASFQSELEVKNAKAQAMRALIQGYRQGQQQVKQAQTEQFLRKLETTKEVQQALFEANLEAQKRKFDAKLQALDNLGQMKLQGAQIQQQPFGAQSNAFEFGDIGEQLQETIFNPFVSPELRCRTKCESSFLICSKNTQSCFLNARLTPVSECINTKLTGCKTNLGTCEQTCLGTVAGAGQAQKTNLVTEQVIPGVAILPQNENQVTQDDVLAEEIPQEVEFVDVNLEDKKINF